MRLFSLEHWRRQLVPLVCLVAVGCGLDRGDREVDLGPLEAIDGLVMVTAQRGEQPARLLRGATPDLAPDVRQAVRNQEFQAVVRVMINADDTVMGVAVLEFKPEDATLAAEYAEQIADSIWHWQFESARHRGDSARGYLDLHFRQGGDG